MNIWINPETLEQITLPDGRVAYVLKESRELAFAVEMGTGVSMAFISDPALGMRWLSQFIEDEERRRSPLN